MNIQQLEYIVAVDEHKHFAKAAEACFVTQPTLSMMIQKLEEELGLKIFDRSKYPITTSKEGEEIIERAKNILNEIKQIKDYCIDIKSDMQGEIRIGIIPTLAPYLLPLFIKDLNLSYPKLRLLVKEITTQDILTKLQSREIDLAILAGPISENQFLELPLFKEPFLVYGALKKKKNSKYVLPQQLISENVWLLEEGHCFRNQVMNFCELRDKSQSQFSLSYEAGSIETLIHLVDMYEGLTIIPQLALNHLKKQQLSKVTEFAKPQPSRQINLIALKNYPRVKLLKAIQTQIINALPKMNDKQLKAIPIS